MRGKKNGITETDKSSVLVVKERRREGDERRREESGREERKGPTQTVKASGQVCGGGGRGHYRSHGVM